MLFRSDEAVKIAQRLVEAERSWASLGRLVKLMEQDEDYLRLGFKTMESCIKEMENLSGYGRSSIFAFKELYADISENAGDDVMQMTLGSAQVYRQLSTELQCDPEIKEAAKTLKAKKFREKLAVEHPQAHIEAREAINLDSSLVIVLDQCVEAMRVLYNRPDLERAQAFEIALSDWCSAPFEEEEDVAKCSKCGAPEKRVSNLDRARQLMSGGKC